MAQKGEQLAVDLSNLRVVGEVDLPMLSYNYAVMNNGVASTDTYQMNAFTRPGGTGTDQVFPGWTMLRDRLQNILGDTAYTLDITGQVMVHIVDVYASTDAAAAASLSLKWQNGPPLLPLEARPPDGAPPDVVIK